MLLFWRLMTLGTPDTHYTAPLILYAFCLAPMLSATSSGTIGKMPPSDQLHTVAIYMTVRQLGASLGVTLVTILPDRRETFHSSRLFEHLRAGGTQAQEWMSTVAQAVVERGGYSPSHAHDIALGLLNEAAATPGALRTRRAVGAAPRRRRDVDDDRALPRHSLRAAPCRLEISGRAIGRAPRANFRGDRS
jgi:DHA2 family multidrug resistance protein